jgi:protein-S-isoprenylcysteine O-methyltransferase Ste14
MVEVGTLQLAAFVGGAAVLAWLSRAALRDPRSHGCWRFLAWVAMLALLVQNAPFWFEDRFAPRQLLSWLLLFTALALLAAGVLGLRRGTPDKGGRSDRDDPALFAFERTALLVTDGIYSLIRHPLYTSLLLLTWGIFLKAPTPPALVCAVLATLFLGITARREEVECLDYFGEAYRDYMARSRRFVPWVY